MRKNKNQSSLQSVTYLNKEYPEFSLVIPDRHLLESPVSKSESGNSPADYRGITTFECGIQGELGDDKDFLKVESNNPDVSKEEVYSFLEHSGYENVTVIPNEAACSEVNSTSNVNILKAKRLRQYCDSKSIEGKYKCAFCEFISPLISRLKQHISDKHRDSFKYTCDKCGKGFLSKRLLHQHTQRIHLVNVKPVSCLKCDHTSISHREHVTHQKLHTPKTKCGLCNFVTWDKRCLQRHTKNKHDPNIILPHQCLTCKKGFSSMSELAKHQRTHSGFRPFKCTLCDYQSSDKFGLRKHVLRKHVLSNLEKKRYRCRLCKINFDAENEFNKHNENHHGFNKRIKKLTLRCKYCDYMFTKPQSLRKHEQNQHIERKLYKCRHCQKKFNTEQEKTEHEQPSESISSTKCRRLPLAKDPPLSKDPITFSVLICDDCNEHFPNAKVLSKHKKYCVFA